MVLPILNSLIGDVNLLAVRPCRRLSGVGPTIGGGCWAGRRGSIGVGAGRDRLFKPLVGFAEAYIGCSRHGRRIARRQVPKRLDSSGGQLIGIGLGDFRQRRDRRSLRRTSGCHAAVRNVDAR